MTVKRVLLVIGVVLLLLVLLLGWVIATPSGSRFALQRVADVTPGLSYSDASGTLLNGMDIAQLEYANGDNRVAASNLSWRWALSCLWDRVLCIDAVSVASLDIVVSPSSDPDESSAPALSDVVLPFGLKVNSLTVGALQYTSGEMALSLSNTRSAFSMIDSVVVIDTLQSAWRSAGIGGQIAVRGKLETTGDYPISASMSLETEVATLGEIALPPSGLQLTLSESLAQLHVDARLSGVAEAVLNARVEPFVQPLPINAVLAVEAAQWPPADAASASFEAVTLKATGDMTRLQTELTGTVFAEAVDSVSLTLTGVLEPARGIEQGEFTVQALGGEASGSLALNWESGVVASLDTVATSLDVGRLSPALDGQISGRVETGFRTLPAQNNALQIDKLMLDVGGSLHERKVSVQGELSLVDGELIIADSGITLGVGDNRALIRGTAGSTLNLSSSLDVVDFSHLLPSLVGTANGTVELRGSRDSPALTAQLEARGIAMGDTRVQGLELQADVLDGGDTASMATLTWQGLNVAAREVGTGTLALAGVRTNHTARLDVDGELASASVQLEGALDGVNWQGVVGDSWLSSAGHRWRTTEAFGLAFQNGDLTVDAHCWQSSPASVCLQNAATLAGTGQVSLGVNAVPVSWVNALLPPTTTLQGVVDGVLEATWVSGAVPAVNASLRATDLIAGVPTPAGDIAPVSLGNLGLRVEPVGGAQGRDDMRVLLDSDGGALGRAAIAVQVPISDPTAYRGEVQWSALELNAFQFLLPDLDSLGGSVEIDTAVVGTAGGPRFDGVLRLRGGELRGLDLPTEILAGRLDVALDGQQATIDGGWRSAEDADDEAIGLSGTVDWRASPTLALRVAGRGLPVDYHPWVRAAVDPDVSITATSNEVRVSGRVRVPQADIEIVAPESQAPTPSSDTVLIDNQREAGSGDDSGLAVDVSVSVELADEVYLSGFGFDSQLQGAFDVRVTPAQPLQLFGNLSILDGRYEAWGQDLGIDDGEIVFSGPPEVAVVDATAWREVDSVRAGVAVRGLVSAPDVQVISEPAMSDQEALSYLVLGRAWDEAGDRQAAITRAALSLGLKRSGGLTDRLASELGLQSLSVEAQGRGDDTSAVVNAQLNDKLSVQYGVGVFVPFRTLTARYQLGRQLYVEAVQGVESALDFFYSIEY